MSRNIQHHQGKTAQQLKCALHICRNLLIRHPITLEFASRFLARFIGPAAQRLQQPQCPTGVDGTALFAEKHIGVTTQENELVTDVFDTREVLAGAGCLAPGTQIANMASKVTKNPEVVFLGIAVPSSEESLPMSFLTKNIMFSMCPQKFMCKVEKI